MKSLLLIIAMGCSSFAVGQVMEQKGQQVLVEATCKESKRDGSYNTFIEWIKKGEQGEGIHYSWMDKMHQLGIKQAFFVLHFSYRKGEYKYKVEEIRYFRHYYCVEGEVTGGKLFYEIRKSGLERELKDAIIQRVKRLERPYQPGNVNQGEEYRYLLDDEHLPIVDFIT